MAGLTDFSRLATQTLQSPIEELPSFQERRQQSQQQALAQQTPMTADMAVLTAGAPSYMQVVEVLAGMRALMEAGTERLNVLHSLAGGDKRDKSERTGLSVSGSDRDAGSSFFNPLSYQVQRPNQKFSNGNGQGGYGSGGRTGGGNVASGVSNITRMLEAALAQSLNRNGMTAEQVQLREDAITLILRTPESVANGFHELTGALVMLLADEMNGLADDADVPGPELRDLIAKLTALQGAGTPISQPHMQALMDEIAVMLLMQDMQQTTPAAAAQNPMANTILQLMQNMLGQRNGETPTAAQLRQLLDVLMRNLSSASNSGDTMKAALLMEQLLPDLLGMIDGETGFIPGSVIRTSRGRVNPATRRGARTLPGFSVKIDSNGLLSSDNIDGGSNSGLPLQYEKNGLVSLLDASDQLELAGGIKIAASMAKAQGGKKKLKVGTFSWNSGNDSVVMNAQGEAIVTNDAGKTWVPLPKAGISTYNPGNGGPSITYNPQIKSITFSAGDGSRKVLGTMYADNDGVNIDMTSTNELTASGQIATMLSPETSETPES